MKYKKYFPHLLFGLIVFIFTACQYKEDKSQTEYINQPSGNYQEDRSLKTDVDQTKSEEQNVKSPLPVTKDGSTTQQINYKQPTEENSNTQDKRMIVRTGTMNLEVDNFDETEIKIKDVAGKFSGYITNSSSQLNASGKKQGTITLRIPADKFDGVLTELSKISKVMNQNISGKDVTEEYMDAEARLKTQRELEARLLKLLAEKTARLTDVVEVETKLASVREQIEKTEGRMRFLRDQASFSTLTISVYEPSLLNTSTGGGFFYELGQSVKKGLEGFTKVLSTVITLVIAFIPLFLIAWIIYILVRRFIRKRKAAKA